MFSEHLLRFYVRGPDEPVQCAHVATWAIVTRRAGLKLHYHCVHKMSAFACLRLTTLRAFHGLACQMRNNHDLYEARRSSDLCATCISCRPARFCMSPRFAPAPSKSLVRAPASCASLALRWPA